MARQSIPDALKKRLRMTDLGGAGAVVLIVALTVMLGILPLRRKAAANVAQAADYQQQLQDLDGLSKTLNQVESDLKKTQGRLGEAESRLPNTGAMDDFMRQLSKVATDTGLQVEEIQPHDLKDAGDYKIMPVTINGAGSFESCYKFLTGLRKMNRLTRLDELVIDKEQARDDRERALGNARCRISVSISTFMAR